MNMLTVRGISKSFGSHKIIENLSFEVPEHSIFGFIGQNGAGKTTTMKMILGLLPADTGEILVNGKKVTAGNNKTNGLIGYLPDVPEYYEYMTPKEYLMMCGRITGLDKKNVDKRANKMLDMVGLSPYKKKIRGFSRGMKQRLGIAQALLHKPKLLICDEPTSALDPLGRKEILDILSSVKEETTVLFSTHILTDVERICDNIAFLNQGKIVLSGSLEEVKNSHKTSEIEILFENEKDAKQFLQTFPEGKQIHSCLLQYTQICEEDSFIYMKYIAKNQLQIQKMEWLEPTLEDLFLEILKEK
ncbi:MAG: ABC transporter ATP-binding protein [Lachnospiraceae bacterium]|nr:ABC transporter ATP-binding protein [Lachnospiraceae bacterium]